MLRLIGFTFYIILDPVSGAPQRWCSTALTVMHSKQPLDSREKMQYIRIAGDRTYNRYAYFQMMFLISRSSSHAGFPLRDWGQDPYHISIIGLHYPAVAEGCDAGRQWSCCRGRPHQSF